MSMQSNQRMVGPYILKEKLGNGGFSKVKRGVDPSGKSVALKILSGGITQNVINQVNAEIMSLRAARHPNVLELVEVLEKTSYPKKNGKVKEVNVVVLEYASGGELFEFLEITGGFEDTIARSYFHQLIKGIAHCHDMGVVHRDLKPENILLDAQFRLKLADFGFGKMWTPAMYTKCGTPGYMAPEMHGNTTYDGKQTDIWAVGVILFIMLAGFPPFQTPNTSDWWFHKLANQRHDLFWRAHCRTRYFSADAKDLINKILCPDPNLRISLDDIQQHNWFNGAVIAESALAAELGDKKLQMTQTKQLQQREAMAANANDRGQGHSSNDMSDERYRDMGEGEMELPQSMEFFSHGIGPRKAPGVDMDEDIEGTAEVYDEERKGACYTRFASEQPASVLYRLLCGALSSVAVEKLTKKEETFKVTGEMSNGMRKFFFSAQVFADADGKTHHVEFKRLQGDGMQFRSLYFRTRDQLAAVLSKD